MPTSAFPSQSLSLATLFRRAGTISVPIFQRPYSWTLRESGQLLEDIAGAADSDQELEPFYDYFLGTILVLCQSPDRLLGEQIADAAASRATSPCEIIDGQQRLATLTILAAVLRDLDEAPVSPLRDRLEALIGTRDTDADDEPYRMHLRAREQRFFADFVLARGACAEMPADETLLVPAEANILATREHFMSELSHLPATERDRLSRYLLDHCHLVVIATDEIDRAHRIFVVLNGRGLPLQRDDILKAEIAQSLPRERATEILARWDRVALRLGTRFEALFGHIRTIHGDTRPQIIAAIRSIIAARGPEAFVTRDLEPLGEALAMVTNPWDDASDLPVEPRRRLVYLNRLNGNEWVPAAMLALRDAASEPERAQMLLAGIDRLAHVTRLMCMGAGKRQQRFVAVMRAIAGRSVQSATDGPFQLTRDDLRVLQYNLRDIHDRAPSMCKLILMRLDDEIAGLLPGYDPGDFSVEHVLPLRTSAGSGWRKTIPDPNARSAATHSLGNLTLLAPKQNDRARNEDFDKKRAIYGSPDVGRPVLAITREVIAHERWGAEEIRAREARLMGLLAKLLQLPLAAYAAEEPDAGEASRQNGQVTPKRRTGTG